MRSMLFQSNLRGMETFAFRRRGTNPLEVSIESKRNGNFYLLPSKITISQQFQSNLRGMETRKMLLLYIFGPPVSIESKRNGNTAFRSAIRGTEYGFNRI